MIIPHTKREGINFNKIHGIAFITGIKRPIISLVYISTRKYDWNEITYTRFHKNLDAIFQQRKDSDSIDTRYEPNIIYILPNGSIYPPTAPIEKINNFTYVLIDNITTGGIIIERDNIVINGLNYTIRSEYTRGSKGIILVRRKNVSILNIQITGFEYGIYLYNSSENNISKNIIKNCIHGIYLSYSSNNYLSLIHI